MGSRITDLEKRLKELEDYVYNFDDFLPARSLVDKARNYIEKLETVTHEDLSKRFRIPETRAKKLMELFIEYGFVVKDEKGDIKVNKEAFEPYSEPEVMTGNPDALFEEAIKIAQEYENVSTSLFQRRLAIGYARAARILDELEAKKIVGPPDGLKPRKVLKK